MKYQTIKFKVLSKNKIIVKNQYLKKTYLKNSVGYTLFKCFS